MENQYLFIVSPPYSGSTILSSLVATSENVSNLPNEGQLLPETKPIMEPHAWKVDKEIPWDVIVPIWKSYWDTSKPILLEKSPPNMVRTDQLHEQFSPAYFLLLVRNPYALCEGIIRRSKRKPKSVAKFVIRLLRYQIKNARNLENALCLTYEELADRPAETAAKIEAFLPELGSLKYGRKFTAHAVDGMFSRPIVNLNQKKLDNLSPQQLADINSVFRNRQNVLDFWGYEIYEPPKNQFFIYLLNKVKIFFRILYSKSFEKVKLYLIKQRAQMNSRFGRLLGAVVRRIKKLGRSKTNP
jgi:hypothetical protein